MIIVMKPNAEESAVKKIITKIEDSNSIQRAKRRN